MTQYITVTAIQNNAVHNMHTTNSADYKTEQEFVKAAEDAYIKMCKEYDDVKSNMNFDDAEEVDVILDNGYFENGDGMTVCITWS